MSFRKSPLRKLLQLFYAPQNLRASKIREDIRLDRGKAKGFSAKGGDFHAPFWADAKAHMLSRGYLPDLVQARVAENKRLARLYPELSRGFLSWWDDKRRWHNEPLNLLPTVPGTQFNISEVGAVVKVEGAVALESGSSFHRIIYPYFSEKPVLPPEGARLAIWAMSQALPHFQVEDLRVLDVLRGNSFGTLDHALEGNEREIFVQKYEHLLRDWDRLQGEIG